MRTLHRRVEAALIAGFVLLLAACSQDAAPAATGNGQGAGARGSGGAEHGTAAAALDDLAGRQPPIVMVMIDTLRADRLGCYGAELPTSPVIDDLAARSHRFTANTSQCNSTFPSITSVMTGLYVKTHANYVAVPIEGSAQLNPEYASLAERLHDDGYYTAGVVSHPLWVDDPIDTAVRRGWDAYSAISQEIPREERVAAAEAGYTNERAFELLDRYEAEAADRPLFLWVHYFDPHTPYTPPAEYADRFLEHHAAALGVERFVARLRTVPLVERSAWIRALEDANNRERSDLILADARAQYDAEIAYNDARIGELFERLERMELLDEALIVFVADHGENMEGRDSGRRNIAFTHERLYEPVVATPLMVRLPRQTEGSVSASLTQNIDIVPTIVDLLDLPAGPRMEGASLRPLLVDGRATLHERVFTESSDNVERALRTHALKYIEPGLGEKPELYRWRIDRVEQDDLISEDGSSVSPAKIAEFERAMGDFRPKSRIGVEFQPWTRDYEVRVEVTVRDGRFLLVEGADEFELSEDGAVARFTVRVTDAVREVQVLPDGKTFELGWRIESTGATPLQSSILLGRTPIERTVVAPLYDTDPTAAVPEEPLVRLAHSGPGTAHEVAIDVAAGAPVEIELRPAETLYGEELVVLADGGLAVTRASGRGMVNQGTLTRLAGDGAAAAAVRVRFDGNPATKLVLVRRDGAWPAPAEFTLDGRAVREDVLGFQFPSPGDGRIASTILAAPPDGGGAPGTIAIWLQSSDTRMSIDTGNLDPALVEELRELGYVR
ncbi:Choline-sulfatase [Planctomycetes bacterium Pla163]|uniref:Choline-sulfatase n=1 Tax=Rohdeia mirabilis TaxID=2528008 RepID=A0A518D476_9BACT|nr:Choline-sulfatase [Planctomycetes bacterium Pla163]